MFNACTEEIERFCNRLIWAFQLGAAEYAATAQRLDDLIRLAETAGAWALAAVEALAIQVDLIALSDDPLKPSRSHATSFWNNWHAKDCLDQRNKKAAAKEPQRPCPFHRQAN